jgi:hypothetical protein
VWATNRICNNAAGEGSVLVLQDDGNIAVTARLAGACRTS